MSTSRHLAGVLLALLVLALAALGQGLEYGVNPSFHGPSSRAVVFADAMRRARDLEPGSTRLFSDVELPPGRWVVEWSGPGTAALSGPVTEVERSAGRAVYEIPRTSRALYVRWTSAAPPHVWLPGAVGETWWPPFVAFLRQLHPITLRTLDWTLANEPPAARDGRLVSPALQVDLVNRLGCGLHYTVPVGLAEPELVALFRTLGAVAGELTLEVGNEDWNSGLWSWHWLDAQPGREVEATAREIDRVFAIAARELPGARHYVGGQLSNPWFLTTVLSLLAPSTRVDACGAAAYVGPSSTPATPQGCVDACLARIDSIRGNVRTHAALARSRGARFELYEAGRSFREGGPVVAAAQRLEGMGDVYRQLAAMLDQEGVDRVIWYSLMTSWDLRNPAPFGIFDSMRGPAAPLGRAVLDLMR